MLKVIRAVDAQLGNTAQVQRASTDANIPLSLGREAIAIGGGGTGGGAHTLQEWFDCNGRELGLSRILLTLLAAGGSRIYENDNACSSLVAMASNRYDWGQNAVFPPTQGGRHLYPTAMSTPGWWIRRRSTP